MDLKRIADLKDSLDIVDWAGRYMTVRRSGRSYMALCPFHAEKTPSFHLFPPSRGHAGRYRCFGCGESGDVIDLTVKLEGMSWLEAVRALAEYANVSLGDTSQPEERREESRRVAMGVTLLGSVVKTFGEGWVQASCRCGGEVMFSRVDGHWMHTCACGSGTPMEWAFRNATTEEWPTLSTLYLHADMSMDMNRLDFPLSGENGVHHQNASTQSLTSYWSEGQTNNRFSASMALNEAQAIREGITALSGYPGHPDVGLAAEGVKVSEKWGGTTELLAEMGAWTCSPRKRLYFPITLRDGRRVSWTGRTWWDGADCFQCGTPSKSGVCGKCGSAWVKWLHEKDVPRNVLWFGEGRWVDGYPAVLVESPGSVVRLLSCGVVNAIASLGSQVSGQQLAILAQWSLDWIVLPDGDKGGDQFRTRVQGMARRFGAGVEVIPPEAGRDPGDWHSWEVSSKLPLRSFLLTT